MVSKYISDITVEQTILDSVVICQQESKFTFFLLLALPPKNNLLGCALREPRHLRGMSVDLRGKKQSFGNTKTNQNFNCKFFITT